MGCYFFFPLDLLGACVNAEAATLFTPLGVLGFCNNFPAFEAIFFEVCSFRFRGMCPSPASPLLIVHLIKGHGNFNATRDGKKA